MRVCVEGNIGSGKSSALAALRLGCDAAVFPEPLEEWDDLLAKFYDDPAAWAFPFSLKVLLSFCRVPEEGVSVVERSPMASRHVFSQLLFNEGKMSQEEWDLFKEYCGVLGWRPDVIVFVHTPADECHRRVAARGRPEERHVDIQHLRRVEFQYETMLRYADVPVLRVDGTRPPDEVAAAVADAVERAASRALLTRV